MEANSEGTQATVQADLIYDLGLHEAQDTEFYLKKGFRVVAVEANERLCDEARRRFAGAVENGDLVIVNRAISDKSGEITFFENDNTEWGTVDSEWAARNERLGHPSVRHVVEATTLAEIISDYGVPYFLKIDIEGMDQVALEGLRSVSERPRYVSFESDKTSFRKLCHEFDTLNELGYDLFKVVPQRQVRRQQLPQPAREGVYAAHQFVFGSSGAFGEEAPGEWMSAEQAIDRYRAVFLQYALTGDDHLVRSRPLRGLLMAVGFRYNWYDTHAKRSGTDKA